MIRPPYLEHINRSLTKTYRAPPSHPSPSSKCTLGYVWISEEGLLRAFSRFLTRWQRTTSDNSSSFCDCEASTRRRVSRSKLQCGRAAIANTAKRAVKLEGPRNWSRDATSRENVFLHQYFRPRIKHPGTKKAYQARTIATLPSPRSDDDADLPEEAQLAAGYQLQDFSRLGSREGVRQELRYAPQCVTNTTSFRIRFHISFDHPLSHHSRSIPGIGSTGVEEQLVESFVGQRDVVGRNIQTPHLKKEAIPQPLTLAALRAKWKKPSSEEPEAAIPVDASLEAPAVADAVRTPPVMKLEKQIGVDKVPIAFSAADAPTVIYTQRNPNKDVEPGDSQRTISGDERTDGDNRKSNDSAICVPEMLKVPPPKPEAPVRGILPRKRVDPAIWAPFSPSDDPYGVKQHFPEADNINAQEHSIAGLDLVKNHRYPTFLSSEGPRPPSARAADRFERLTRYRKHGLTEEIPLVFAADKARSAVTASAQSLPRLSKEQKRALELEYKLSRASHPMALNRFVDLFYERKPDKNLENRRTATTSTGMGDRLITVILGYWMLRLMLPREFFGLHLWNLKHLLIKLVLEKEWQTALWILYQERQDGWTQEKFDLVSSTIEATNRLSRQKHLHFDLAHVWKIFALRSNSVVVPSVNIAKDVESLMSVEGDFANLDIFRARVSKCSRTENLLSMWIQLKEYKNRPFTFIATPALGFLINKAVELRLNNVDVWSQQENHDLLFMCVDIFLSLNKKEQAMLLDPLVSFLEVWIDLAAQQANKLFGESTREGDCDGVRSIPYLSAFILYLDQSVRYEAVRVILQKILLREIDYMNRHRQKPLGDFMRETYNLEEYRDISPDERTAAQARILNLFSRETANTAILEQERGKSLETTTRQRPWSWQTLWPLLEVAKHESSMSTRSEAFSKEWRTHELAEMLLEFKGRSAVATYLRECSDVQVLSFVVRAWLRRADRWEELLVELRKKYGMKDPKMPATPREFKEYILRKVCTDKATSKKSPSLRQHPSEETPSKESEDEQQSGAFFARAISTLSKMGFQSTQSLISEILYTLISLQRTPTIISFTKLLRDRSQADQKSQFSIAPSVTVALANYFTLHHPPSALFFLTRLLRRSIPLHRNFILLHAGDNHHLARIAYLSFLSTFPKPLPLPFIPSSNNNNGNNGNKMGKGRTPSWTWWHHFSSAQSLKSSARDIIAGYARGVAVSPALKPRQSVRRCRAALITGLRLGLGPDIRVAEALLFCVVVRRAQQELLEPMPSVLLDVEEFVRRVFNSLRAGHYVRLLRRVARDQDRYKSEKRKGGSMGEGEVVLRAEMFVKWLREVVFVMRCKGGRLEKEDIRWMYCMDGDPNWRPGGIRFYDDM